MLKSVAKGRVVRTCRCAGGKLGWHCKKKLPDSSVILPRRSRDFRGARTVNSTQPILGSYNGPAPHCAQREGVGYSPENE